MNGRVGRNDAGVKLPRSCLSLADVSYRLSVDWNVIVQAGSLLVVALALIISAIQLNHSARQTRVLTQTMADSVREARGSAVMQLSAMLQDNPDVLRWHLRARGYPQWAIEDNRTIFAVLRLQIHESTHLAVATRAGRLPLQDEWLTTLRADLSDSFYRALWPFVRRLYSSHFARIVDDIIASTVESKEAQSTAEGEASQSSRS